LGCFEFIFMSEIDLLLFPNSACWSSWLLLPCFFDLQCGSNPCLWLLVPGLVLKPSWNSHIFDCLDPCFGEVQPPLRLLKSIHVLVYLTTIKWLLRHL
jgi:hypothetical protein